MDNKIPKLSLSKLLLNDNDTTKTLSNALSNHGFFVITDHDIPHKLFDKAYEYSENFLILTQQQKINIHLDIMQVPGVIRLLVKKLH